MPVETADDRAIILADFGESVTFMPEFGTNATITAIFDNTYEAVEAGGTVGYQLVQPRLTVRTSDITGIQDGDAFKIRGNIYIVRIIMADGTGITELALEAQ